LVFGLGPLVLGFCILILVLGSFLGGVLVKVNLLLLRTKNEARAAEFKLSILKDQRSKTQDLIIEKRQATLAIARLFLSLSRYLSIGGASEAVKYIPGGGVWQ
jgi:hypothetical protein